MSIGIDIESKIKKQVEFLCITKKLPELKDIIETDNIGEVIEKLCIVHIRMWMLEDDCCKADTDEKMADIKRKTDICYKQIRPRLVEAINRMIDNSIITGKSLIEDSVKRYKK
ncbi:MAG: hypothetical protein QQN41_04860 [Nitrosopumilus sp.]